VKRVLTTLLMTLVLSTAVLAESPNTVVEEAARLLAEQLDGRKGELAADRAALHEVINGILLPRFDRKYSAQLVLGKHWRNADTEQRKRFIDAFYSALLQRYADGVLEFDQDRIEILPYRGDDTKPRTMVRSVVRLEDGSKVPVNYGLVRRENGWLLFDVTIEGVSYVRNFRAELDSEIRVSSLSAVIERLEKESVIATDG
jgi:phospholipid transport system substrate-binding protein